MTATLLLALVPWLGLLGPAQEGGASAEARVAEALERSASHGDARRLASELRSLRRNAAAELLRILIEGETATSEGRRSVAPFEEQALVEALSGLPHSRLVRLLAEWVEVGAPADGRVRLLELLRARGKARDLHLLARLAPAGADDGRVERSVVAAFELALEEVLLREPTGWDLLEPLYGVAHPSLLRSVLAVLGRSGRREAFELLVRLLGRVKAADPLVLLEVGRLGERLGPPHGPEVLSAVRDYLDHSEPRIVGQAAGVLRALRDHEAVPHLVERLGHGSLAVRQACQATLVALTGLQHPPDEAVWSAWLQSELAFWESDAATLTGEVAWAEPPRAAAAMRALAAHRLFPDRIARALRPALSRPEPELVRLACSAIGALGGNEVFPELVDGLDHPDPAVSRAALSALQTLTGFRLQAGSGFWRDLLFE